MRNTAWALAVSAWAAAIALAAGLGAAACGPSFQTIYEGDARFEHCYALDESTGVPMGVKVSCWRDWTQHYTYGQTRDRLAYATARYNALRRVPELPTDEAMMSAAPGEVGKAHQMATPAPTNAFAPPPNVMTLSDAGPDAAEPERPSTARRPGPDHTAPNTGDACLDACQTTRLTCWDDCGVGACTPCESHYEGCLKACKSHPKR